MTETGNEIVQLNQYIGYHLLTFLEGIDASNFLEVVHNTAQFSSMATTSDHICRQLIRETFRNHQKILLPREIFEDYLEECEVVDDKLVLLEEDNSSFIQPRQRLFVYSCFSIEGFGLLCKAYRTSLFQCYSRLIPFNSDLYWGDFGLVDYELYSRTISLERDLNDQEQQLFKINTHFNTTDSQRCRTNMKFVNTVNEFRENFAIRFLSNQWLDAIDFTRFVIVGGCVINALCHLPFADTNEQDINLIYPSSSATDFEKAVDSTITRLQTMISKNSKHEIKVEKTSGSLRCDITLPCGVKLNFMDTHNTGNSQNPISHIIHNFDIDICQVAFTGNKIISTFAFLQAIATKTFLTYSLHAETTKNVCIRIAKYCARGFHLLEPINFDGDFDRLMKKDEIPLYRFKQREFIDDEGEVQISTTEYWRRPARNIDTFQRQEAFIAAVCP